MAGLGAVSPTFNLQIFAEKKRVHTVKLTCPPKKGPFQKEIDTSEPTSLIFEIPDLPSYLGVFFVATSQIFAEKKLGYLKIATKTSWCFQPI